MPTLKLNARPIPSLKPRADGQREVYRDAVVPGLYLEVHPTGRRVFGVWHRAAGRAGRVTSSLLRSKGRERCLTLPETCDAPSATRVRTRSLSSLQDHASTSATLAWLSPPT